MNTRIDWTIDELILALDLYFKVNPKSVSPDDPSVIELSELLNRLPLHPRKKESEKFRNPNGVRMKLSNFLRLDPTYGKKGLPDGSKLDEIVWERYSNDILGLRQVADSIRTHLDHFGEHPDEMDEPDEVEAIEGRILSRSHLERERRPDIVREKKQAFMKKHGHLYCEICSFDFSARYGSLGDCFIECHHVIPLSTLAPGTKTKLADLTLVCANCHRMLHRGRAWPSVGQVRNALLEQSVKP